jgi:class 3 adenylate cyclase
VRFAISELTAAGLYDPTAPGAADRLALLEWLGDQGATLERLAHAVRTGTLDVVALELGRARGPRLTLEEASARTGLSVEQIRATLFAVGLPATPGNELTLTEDDTHSLQAFAAGEALFGRAAIRRFTQVVGASLARIAEAAIAVSSVNLEGPLVKSGASELALAQARMRAAETTRPLAAAISHLFRAHLEVAGRRLRSLRPEDSHDTARLTVGFVDLVGFTTLSHRIDVPELARVVDRFEEAAHDVTTSYDGRVIKFVGDEVMFVTPAAEAGCDIAISLIELFVDDPSVTPRGGLAAGEVLVRGGDYYGPVVNLAARLAELAVPQEVLVSDDLRAQAAGGAFRFEPAGRRLLKGFDAPVRLFAAERSPRG